MTVVASDYTLWSLRYPEFGNGNVSEPLFNLYWAEAAMYCANDDCALIPADPTTYQPRLNILNALTAHVAALNATVAGQAPSPLVGRIASAGEGSVNVAVELDTPQSAAYFTQTKYGLAAWQMMASFRTARYCASPGRFAQPNLGTYATINGRPYWGFRQ